LISIRLCNDSKVEEGKLRKKRSRLAGTMLMAVAKERKSY
jgi:hypothetical protein